MKPGESILSPRNTTVTPGYFQAMGIPIVRGRDFTEQDVEKAEPAIIIDEKLARRFWPDRDPIGQRMFSPADASRLTPDANTRWVSRGRSACVTWRRSNRSAPTNTPYPRNSSRAFTLAIRTQPGAGDLTRAIRAEVSGIDPLLALFDVRTMAERTELSFSSRRTSMTLATAFAGLALFLSATGIYGVLASGDPAAPGDRHPCGVGE